MEVVIPYILTIVLWSGSHPKDTMTVSHQFTQNRTRCEALASDMRTKMAKDTKRPKYKFRIFCVEAPEY
jgi:hypothetical protein